MGCHMTCFWKIHACAVSSCRQQSGANRRFTAVPVCHFLGHSWWHSTSRLSMSLTRNEMRINASAPRRNLMRAAAFVAGWQLGKRPIMLTRPTRRSRQAVARLLATSYRSRRSPSCSRSSPGWWVELTLSAMLSRREG